VDDEDMEDDTCWRYWQKQFDAFVAYLRFTWIGRKADEVDPSLPMRCGTRSRP
jgi:hypothetical protein